MISTRTNLESFAQFLGADFSEDQQAQIHAFLYDDNLLHGKRELVFDRGEMLFMEKGKQVAHMPVSLTAGSDSRPDRVVHFDGIAIQEVNPYAYLPLQAKGDGSGTGSKRRGGGSSFSATSSNNNNNNNNNNG